MILPRAICPTASLTLLVINSLWGAIAQGQHASLQSRLEAEPVEQLAEDAARFGDPVRGALAFHLPTMNCAKCHESSANGRRLGPDLSEKRPVELVHLVESVLHPSAKIREGYESAIVQMEDGRSLQGVLISHNDDLVVLDQIEQPDQPLRLTLSEIDEWQITKTSSMPEQLVNQLVDRNQFLDLIRYLKAIADGGPAAAASLRPAGLMVLAPVPAYEARIDHRGLIQSWDDAAFQRGAETYRLKCASCHGTLDQEGSMPTSLRFASGQFKQGSDPLTMYRTLTHGFGMMNAQRWMVPQQKYEVIHYIREHFLKSKDPSQYVPMTEQYLASLPSGDTRGPTAKHDMPWAEMDYGPSLNNTIEVSRDGTNIAQKGIAIRLDDEGPGGVESGRYWMLYDHDTMRVAGAWSGQFIDYNGIHFNGVHGRHPRIRGDLHLENPAGPGWARPTDGSFADDRLVGRDGRRYGPLARDWSRFLGLYRFGKKTLIQYTAGGAEILESPRLELVEGQPVFVRTLNIGARAEALTLQVARLAGEKSFRLASDHPSIAVVGLDETTGGRMAEPRKSREFAGMVAAFSPPNAATWSWQDERDLRLTIPAGETPTRLEVRTAACNPNQLASFTNHFSTASVPADLQPLTRGGPRNWPEILETAWEPGDDSQPFAVDVLRRPVTNPWSDRLRLTGIDFLDNGHDAVISSWDGSIWLVRGMAGVANGPATATWQRIAAGLFQPLGIKIVNGQIYVTCRDQIVKLHDLNGDAEIDWYENFNSDHQVTEHFHEFAMGLQTDDEGNFYYAKSARHALPALVPHHGTLLKVSRDGSTTEIVATGFRAANGVCLNPDGTYFVTDQEGHWTPKNRINWVRQGGFYGNMYGYHNVADSSDEAMSQPLCWITNSFDRSPSELLWVPESNWGPLGGSLLNFSYGFGQIYVVPHENVQGQMQGGMCALPLPRFPTGVMRGRFHPVDGQLYCCGMFAWAGDQQQAGGMYRVRYTGQPVYLPIGLQARKNGIQITLSDAIDPTSAADPANYKVQTWDLKRTEQYGSEHYNEKRLSIQSVEVTSDGETIFLEIPGIRPTWEMEIAYAIQTKEGQSLLGRIHNTIHSLAE